MSSLKQKPDQQEKVNELVVLNKQDLISIKEKAHEIYVDSASQDMDSSQFQSYCYVKATLDFLHSKGVELAVEFSKRILVESVD